MYVCMLYIGSWKELQLAQSSGYRYRIGALFAVRDEQVAFNFFCGVVGGNRLTISC